MQMNDDSFPYAASHSKRTVPSIMANTRKMAVVWSAVWAELLPE